MQYAQLRAIARSLMQVTLALLLVALGALGLNSRNADAIVPTTMNFQGRLASASGSMASNGLYNMRFRIFTAATGGTQLWTETRETTNRVQVTNGLFSVQLGAVTPLAASVFNSAGTLYFEIELPTPATANCSTASCQSWTEGAMTPRSAVATSAYAFNSATLDGIAASGFIKNQSVTPQGTASFWLSGSARTDTAFLGPRFDAGAAGVLTVGNTNATSIALGKAGVTTTANGALTAAGLLTGSAGATLSGVVTVNSSGANAVNINTGTATGATTIGNSAGGVVTVRSASTVGITGTTTISGLASGSGTALVASNSTSTGSILELRDNATSVMTVSDGGAVLAKNSTNSSAAFAIQNATSYNLFTADTSSTRIVIGTAGGDTTGAVLVLGHKTTTGNPTGVPGAMYYNGSDGKFKCYEGTGWKDCITALPQLAVMGADVSSTSSSTPASATGASFAVAANTKYYYKFIVSWDAGDVGSGIGFGMTAPASPVGHRYCVTTIGAVGDRGTPQTSASGGYCQTGDANDINVTGTVADPAIDYSSTIEGYIETGATAGALQLRYIPDTTAGVTIRAGSFGILQVVQ